MFECEVCGARTRTQVCPSCRKRLQKALEDAQKHPSIPYVPMNIGVRKVEETKVG